MTAITSNHPSIPLPIPSPKPRVQNFVSTFEAGWNYAGKSLLLTRHVLNSVIRTCRWVCMTCTRTDQKIRALILRLKLFSIISIPLNSCALITQSKRVWQNIQKKDSQGIISTSLSLTILAADILDSMTTFTNATLELLAYRPIAWMSAAGMPLVITMIAGGSLSRGLRLRNIAVLEKQLVMEKSDLSKIHTQEILNKEKRVQKGYLLANFVNAIGITTFSLSVAAWVPFAILSAGLSIRIAMQFYQDFKTV